MKQLISQNDAHKVYAELTEVSYPRGQYALCFTSEWNDGESVQEQQKFTMFISKEQKDSLRQFLS